MAAKKDSRLTRAGKQFSKHGLHKNKKRWNTEEKLEKVDCVQVRKNQPRLKKLKVREDTDGR